MTRRIQTRYSLDEIAILLQAADVALWHVDLSSRTLGCTPLFTRLTGVPNGASSPDFHEALAVPGDAVRIRKLFDGCVTGQTEHYAATFRLAASGEATRWARIAVAVTDRGSDGKPLFLTGMLRDVTKTEKAMRGLEEKAQLALRKERDLLRTINEIASGLLAAETGTFEEAVRKAMDMIARAADVDRLRIWRNYREADGTVYALEMYQWAKSPRWKTTRVFVSRESATPCWWNAMADRRAYNARTKDVPPAEKKMLEENEVLSIVAIPIFIRDEFWGFIGFDDCTRGRIFSTSEENLLQSGGNIIVSAILRNEMTASLIKAREAALASARAKTDFLSRMSHEIRTPLNAIIGMSVIAEKSGDMAKMTECLRTIDVSSRQLLGIINDVLDMSKIEADTFRIREGDFDLEAMLRDIGTIMEPKLEEKGHSFRYDMVGTFPRRMVGDELRLSQVLLNLLSNAVKFTPEGG